MLFFAPNKLNRVQGFIARLLNNNCSELKALAEGPRLDCRVNLTMPVLVIPVDGGRPVVDGTFPALSKDFSTAGISIVVDRTRPLNDLIVAIRWEGEMYYLRGQVCHQRPMGAGFHHLGIDLHEMVRPHDVPALRAVSY